MASLDKVLSGDAPLKGGMLWLTAILLAAANFIAVLDMTIANVSVPSIAGSLGISSNQGTWVITSYSVAEAIVVPLTGWLAGRFGAVRLFATAMVLFGAFSTLCGFSNSLGMLVLARVLQGLSGGLLMPLSQTLLLRIFPKEKAAAATALWAMTTLVAPVLGPILGGWLCDNYAWPVIFLINVPLTLIVAPIAWRMLKRYQEKLIHAPMDRIGLALLILFVSALQLMLDLGKDEGWFDSTLICTLATTAVVGFLAFLIWESAEKHPIVNLKVFRHRGFSASVVTISLGFGAMFGANVLTPLWLQSYMGYTATWAGFAAAWTGVLAVFGAPMAGVLLTKTDPRRLVFLGLLWLGGVMLFRTGATTDMSYWQVSTPLLVMGLGLPFFFVPLTALALGSVEEHETASAAGLMNFIRTLSGAVATSIVTTVWEDKTTYMHAELAGLVDRSGEAARQLASMGLSSDAVRSALNNLAQGQSVMLATNEIMAAVAVAFGLGALVIWLAPRPTRKVDMTQAGIERKRSESMRGLLTFLLVAVACWSTPAAAGELGVLMPVMENGKPLQKADPRGPRSHLVPVVTQVRSGALYDKIQKEATQGATAVTLAIDELAQRKAGATNPSTTWLFLAVEDGGFARQGFWLRPTHDDRERPDGRDRRDRNAPEEDSTERFVPDLYVDLVVDASTVADGGFEEIFAHEMGHVFLRRLLPRLPDGYSRTAHMSLAVTDNPTAFDEGFATHMQGLMRRITHNESLRNQDLGLEQKPFVAWWLSNLDRAHRIDGVRRNWFVQAQIPLPGTGDAVTRRDQSTLFDTARLKNGNQMMASEGVIATLFYRWLVPGSPERAAVLERYSQLFDALVVLNRQPPVNQKLDPDAPFFLDLLDAYRKTNAKDAARVLAMMIDTTYGATADASLAPQFEVLAAHGRTGDMSAFVGDLKVARAALTRLQDSVARSPEKARAALGPSVWLFRDKPNALAVNLNTAEREQLMQLPGVDSSAADRALESRRARGPFRDVNDFAKRSSLSAMASTQLVGMIEAMTKAGTFARE